MAILFAQRIRAYAERKCPMSTFPAGTGEKMQYLVHECNDNTMRFILRYPGRIDADILRRAVHAVVMSVDVLHASFDPGVLRACWHCHDKLDEQDYFCLIPHADDPAEEAIRQSLLPVLPQGNAQLHCCLVQGDIVSAVAIRMSHLCMDGSDARYLLGKLAEAYALIRKSGSAEGLHIKNGSRAPEQLYQSMSKEEMRSLLKSPATGIKSPYPYPTEEAGTPQMVHRTIPSGVMDAARRRAKAGGATANDLLLSACYHAYAHTPGVDASAPLSVMSMMDLRRHCPTGDSEGLSNLSGALPTALPNGLPEDFEALLADIAQQTQHEKNDPHAGLVGIPLIHKATRTAPLRLLTRMAGGIYGSVGIGLTNLGNIRCEALALDGLTPTDGWFGGPLKKKPHMQVSAASFDGACTLTVAGQYTQEDAQSLQDFLERMAQAVEAFA